MKKKISLLWTIIVVVFMAPSCGDNATGATKRQVTPPDGNPPDSVAPIVYPIEVPFTEYSLEGSSCRWNWASITLDSVIAINSHDEFKNYVICESGDYPDTDFSKNSLLIIRGFATQDVFHVDVTFFKETENTYSMNITVHISGLLIPMGWLKSIFMEKIHETSNINLNIQKIWE